MDVVGASVLEGANIVVVGGSVVSATSCVDVVVGAIVPETEPVVESGGAWTTGADVSDDSGPESGLGESKPASEIEPVAG